MIDHAKAYVDGHIHTNSMENFWSLLKCTINGTSISVDAPHLGRYVDEQVFRFNERKTNDAGRFALVMPGVVGKRLMYKTLIGADTADNCKKDGADGGRLGELKTVHLRILPPLRCPVWRQMTFDDLR